MLKECVYLVAEVQCSHVFNKCLLIYHSQKYTIPRNYKVYLLNSQQMWRRDGLSESVPKFCWGPNIVGLWIKLHLVQHYG